MRRERRDSSGMRQFQLDDEGNRISVQCAQRQLFGREWARQWQSSRRPRDGASSEEPEREDALRALGPKGEVVDVGIEPPRGVSGWEELGELQGTEKKACEKSRAKEIRMRERQERIEAVRKWLRRLRIRLSGSERAAMDAPCRQTVKKEALDATETEMKADSGYASREASAM